MSDRTSNYNLDIDGDFKGIQGNISGGNVIQNINTDNSTQIIVRQTDLELIPSLNHEEKRSQEVLLRKVEARWIENVLNPSLRYTNNYISIHWQNSPAQIDFPFKNYEEFSDENQQIHNTEIDRVFIQMGEGRTLLILGEPGVGKTTMLLKLLEGLIQQIKHNNKSNLSWRIPVVFNLSSWKKEEKDFTQWLVQELNSKYEIKQTLAANWLEKQQLVLLLDGLDEVKQRHRSSCIQKINEFRQNHGETEIVICSRIKEYELLAEKLKLDKAICIQSLTLEQIQVCLDKTGEDSQSLKSIILENRVLRTLAKNPLMLTIMIFAYKDVANQEDLSNKNLSEDEWRKHLFDTYILKMLKHRPNSKKYQDDEQTKFWLSWLGKKMQDDQSIFYIEQIQPSWLLPKSVQKIYRVIVGLIIGLILGLIAGFYLIYTHDILPINLKILLLSFGIFSGLIYGMLLGQKNKIRSEILREIILGFAFGTPLAILPRIIKESNYIDIGVHTITLIALFAGYISKLLQPRIQAIQIIKPEFKKILKYSVILLAWGILYASLRWLTDDVNYQEEPVLLLYELAIFMIFGAFYGGFEIRNLGKAVDRDTSPNRGVKISLKYTTLFLFIFGILAMVLAFTVEEIRGWELIYIGLIVGLIAGLAGNQGSGIVLIQHVVLRFALWLKGDIPFNYARFLNFATEQLFLRQIGGGYIFIHRMLLEHFAEMELNQPKFNQHKRL